MVLAKQKIDRFDDMVTLLLTLMIMVTIVAGMAVGVIFQNKPITGSCGGLNRIGLDGKCEICGGDQTKCETETQKNSAEKAAALSYDATKK